VWRPSNKEVKTKTETKTNTAAVEKREEDITPLSLTAPAQIGLKYTQADFDARDLRKLAEADKDLEHVLKQQPWLTDDDLDELRAQRTGLRLQRVLDLKHLQIREATA
jgi:hypothetical protein